MARPRKANADWFQHDTDMRNDRKVRALRNQFGALGYATFTMLLEVLADSTGFCIAYNDAELELLAGDFDMKTEELKAVLETMFRVGLMQKNEEGNIYNARLTERLSPMIEKREIMRSKYEKAKPTETPEVPKVKKVSKRTTMTHADFEQFWDAYPNKTNKKKAQDKFMKLEQTLLPEILSAIEKQKKGRQWCEGFISHPTTWLSGERWQDDVHPNSPSHGQSNSGKDSSYQRKDSPTEGVADFVL